MERPSSSVRMDKSLGTVEATQADHSKANCKAIFRGRRKLGRTDFPGSVYIVPTRSFLGGVPRLIGCPRLPTISSAIRAYRVSENAFCPIA